MNIKQTMNHFFISFTLLTLTLTPVLAGDTNTTVYKTINPDGSITFSDINQSNAEEIQIKPITTVPALDIPKRASPLATDQTKTSTMYYESLEIISPKSGTALYSGNGELNVKVSITPPLRSNDQLQFQLDGTTIATQTGLELNISAVNRGTHRINVNIVNQRGAPLLTTQNTVTVHRPIAR